jgi:hypothetical protein
MRKSYKNANLISLNLAGVWVLDAKDGLGPHNAHTWMQHEITCFIGTHTLIVVVEFGMECESGMSWVNDASERLLIFPPLLDGCLGSSRRFVLDTALEVRPAGYLAGS